MDIAAEDAWRHLIESWDSAYEFAHEDGPAGEEWFTATRRDNGQALTADSPEELRLAVIKNYFGRRVSRDIAP